MERRRRSHSQAAAIALAVVMTVPVAPQALHAQTSAPAAAAPSANTPAPALTQTQAVPSQAAPSQAPASAGSATAPSATAPAAPSSPASAESAPQPAPPATETVPVGTADASPILPHELTPMGMFMAADYIVKAVMIGLAFASVVTWSVWLAKSLELLGARRKLMRDLRRVESARSLQDASSKLVNADSDIATLTNAALDEINRSRDAMNHDGIKERVGSLFSRIEAAAARRMTRGTSILATIGSTAPFVGLFGTVWGIMNSFIGISKSQTTNLAVVAPGIAEALLATAMGLVAAIPAVMIYNMFARAITSYRGLLGDGSAELMRMVSRDLNRAELTPHRRAAE
ncbi:MAG TPA: tonB-system energizer ExbB [Xanthobacteraceae bacterium]|nr:tonB-system energizer ExbB [Xanthobacteraceae bacterium]